MAVFLGEEELCNLPCFTRRSTESRFLKGKTRKDPFSFENFWLLATVALSFLFGKNCPIMDYLGLKVSSHDFSANCVISFFSSTFNTPCMCRKI